MTVESQTLAELGRRTAMLDAVGYAATQIVEAADWRIGIQELLDRLGRATEVSRATLFEAHEDAQGRRVQSCRYDWAEPGLAPISTDRRYHDMPLSDDDCDIQAGEWARRRERGEVVQATLGETTGYTRQVFLEHGTLSFVSVPVMVDSAWWGFLGFDDCKIERVWSPLEIDILRTAAALIAGSIARARRDEQLRLSDERARATLLTALDGIVTIDDTGKIVDFNPAAESIFGHRRADVIDRPMVELIVPPDRRAQHCAGFARFLATGEGRMIGQRCELEALHADGRCFPIEMAITHVQLGERRLFTAFLRDITERQEFQRQLTEAERKRASLARYFSPNMVDEMMQADGELETARSQLVTVLFADMIGFTTLSADLPSVEIIALLREYLGHFEEAVFAHGGTLDKYLGDGVMATFGTPRPGPQDATNAVACATAMAEKIVAWNTERMAEGLVPLRIGIGLHHGEVVLGDIGGERRLEYAVIGDTVNVASRVQDMTRTLDIAILASEAVVEAVRREGSEGVLAGFRDLGSHGLRGRRAEIGLWGRRAEP